MEDIQDRIKEIVTMRLGDIAHNPSNWKKHPDKQKEQIKTVVKRVGFGDVVKAYRSPRLNNQLVLLDGHGRKEAMPDIVVRVAILDYTDEEADEYLATFDSVGDGAELDPEAWLSLTKEMSIDTSGLLEEKTTEAELLLAAFKPQDFSDLDKQFDDLDGYQEEIIKIEVPKMYKDKVIEWLADGNQKTAPGMGKAVMKRMGII